MASTIKIKFAGFLRGLLRHMDDRQAPRSVASAALPAATSVPAPVSAPTPPTPADQLSAPPAAPAPASTDELTLPLAAVIAHLPMDLKAKLMSTPSVGQTIALAVDKVVSQLAFGSVKISFGELRRLAPGIFANSGGEFDSRQISLPLAEILTRLNPALLSRKPAQKVDVAEEVAGPFDGRGRGITFTTQPLKPSAAAPPAADASRLNQPVPFTPPPLEPPAAIPPRAVTPAPSTSDAELFSFKTRQTAPPAAPIPFNPMVTPPTTSNGHLPSQANGNGNGHGHANGLNNNNGNGQTQSNGHGQTVLPPFKFTTAPTPVTPVNSSSPRPEPAQPKLHISLDDLAENWPDAVKQEIVGAQFASANVPLPMNLVEAGLKRGRVSMTWKEIRTLVKPSSPASPNDGLSLDLPLKVLAPEFLSAQKQSGKLQKRLVVAEEIPNLFFGFPQAVEPHPEPASVSVPAAPVAPAQPKSTDTNFFTNDSEELLTGQPAAPATDFINRHTHPKEIVARALVLPGVAGAVVTLADGLRVASQVPADLNADAVAAFLPQIYERVNQTTRELRMGALNNVSFTIGNVPWKIFRINSIYFAAFGRAGEALPKAQLAGLAAELDRKRTL